MKSFYAFKIVPFIAINSNVIEILKKKNLYHNYVGVEHLIALLTPQCFQTR